MKRNHIMMAFMLVLTAYACKKEKKIEPETPVVNDDNLSEVSHYSNLNVGNYWIYQEFNSDSLGNLTPTTVYDSCFIEKDSLIRGNTYFKLVKPSPLGKDILFLRDSADCIINENGHRVFSVSDFSAPIAVYYYLNSPTDTTFKVVTQMTDKNLTIKVPAGVFSCYNVKQTFYPYPSVGTPIRYKNAKYAKDVGIVMETAYLYAYMGFGVERKLVRYHLK